MSSAPTAPASAFADFAVFAHQQQAAANVNANLRAAAVAHGPVHLNAPRNQVVSIRQGGVSVRLGVSAAGNVIVGGESDLAGAPAGAIFQVNGDVFKSTPGVWGASDARVKEDVRDLELGLSELRQVRPVRFRYNGRAGTPAGRASVGVLGQEIETIVPETVQRVSVAQRSGARRHARLRPLGADVCADQRGERAGRQGRAAGAGARAATATTTCRRGQTPEAP